MNRIYRVVWSEHLAACVAAPEHACRRGKRAGICGGAAALALLAGVAHALPTGGQVTAGLGGIASSGGAMIVTQQSQNLAINWQSFGVGAGEAVSFAQPNSSAIALNRVLGADPSQIYGRLSANGQVWLLNPNGVLFGPTAQVNVGGLVASTLNLSDADFLAGKRTFGGSGGAVVNQGSITASDGGYVTMLGGKVSNEGTIQARLGTVALGAGSRVTLDFAGDKLLSLQVDQGLVAALAENQQLIRADGGTVLLSARAADGLLGTVVNNSGVIEARTIDTRGGTIRLVGGKEGGAVEVSGTLDASAPDGGNGGFIETSGARVKVADGATITTAAPFGTTGTWLIDPTDYDIAASGGDITGAALAQRLDLTNVAILSSAGATAGAGDIDVNDAVGWNSANSLTLSALHSVNVNRPISNGGSGGVTLRADNAGACVAGATGCGSVNFSTTGHVTVNGGEVNIYYNPVGSSNAADANGNGPSYAMPTDYGADVTLGGGSTLTAWMLVNDVNQLQAINTHLAGDYALNRDIDAAVTRDWNGGAGFVPIGTATAPFTGRFDGQGNAIDRLTIVRPTIDYVGLFGASAGTLTNLALTRTWIVGRDYVGTLAGLSLGPVSHVEESWVAAVSGNRAVGGLIGATTGRGTVTDSHVAVDVSGNSEVGGLVGRSGAAIIDSDAAGNVESHVEMGGGLVGTSDAATTITRSFATGTVQGRGSGGLVGGNAGNIVDSYATGAVGGDGGAGGLVAFNAGNIVRSHASGNVSTAALGGGLVGSNSGAISESYATGSVNGGDQMGGLVGSNGGDISASYATGNVSSLGGSPYGAGHGDMVGGLVGINAGTVTTSYATGDVASLYGRYVGGLVGLNVAGESHPTSSGVQNSPGIVSASYATGSVSGVDSVGGLVGANVESLSGPVANGRASITDSHATGPVSGAGDAGGLVGSSNGSIAGSYATGEVQGRGTLGGLVGRNAGVIHDSWASGDVSGRATAGGLVGYNDPNGSIADSYATGDVYGLFGAGGLVGVNRGRIENVYATGSANSQEDGSFSGGLVGFNGGTVVNARAMGDVVSWNVAGGLIGINSGAVSQAHASGDVRAYHGPAGGLAGSNSGSISIAYATGSVTGSRTSNGGLVGLNSGALSQVFASGDVVGDSFSAASLYNGGLVGYNSGSIENAYATGSVSVAPGSTADYNAGLVAYNTGTIAHTYSTGAVSGALNNGGLAAFNSGSIIDSYWDVTTSGQTASAGGTGLTDKQMKRRKSFVGFDFDDVWSIRQGRGYPTLQAF